MMKKFSKLIVIGFLVSLLSCTEKEKEINVDPETTEEEGQTRVDGQIDLPENLTPESMTLITSTGSYEVKEDGSFTAAKNGLAKQFLVAENSSGDILLASLNESSPGLLNAKSTARAILGLAPWTASLTMQELTAILDELSSTDAYKDYENAIQAAINSGASPLNDTDVLERLASIFVNTSLAGKSAAFTNGILELPEIDLLVEPVITYSNGNMRIQNDGTTTAVWGVEVFVDKNSITDHLMLEGNTVKFPSLGSIWDFIKGDITDAVFEKSSPLNIPITTQDKYEIQFGSPTGWSLNPGLSFEATKYNIYKSYQIIFKSIGIPLKGLKASEYFDQGCVNDIFDGTTDVLVESLRKGEVSATFFLEQVGKLLGASATSLSECTDMFNNFPGSKTTSLEVYLKKAAQFIKAYEKLEASFVTGKLIGDMLVLSDVNVCRQVIDGKMYPCFFLVENLDLRNKKVNTTFNTVLDVRTALDISDLPFTYPIGAPIHWEVIEGDGSLSNAIAKVDYEGRSKVNFTAGESEKYVVKASIKDKNGKDLDFVEYNLELEPENNWYEGCWHASDNPVTYSLEGNSIRSSGSFQDNLALTMIDDSILISYKYSAGLANYTVDIKLGDDPNSDNLKGKFHHGRIGGKGIAPYTQDIIFVPCE